LNLENNVLLLIYTQFIN